MNRCWQTQLLALSAIYTVLTQSESLLKEDMNMFDRDEVLSEQLDPHQQAIQNKKTTEQGEWSYINKYNETDDTPEASVNFSEADSDVMQKKFRDSTPTVNTISLSHLIQILNESISLGNISEDETTEDVIIGFAASFEEAGYILDLDDDVTETDEIARQQQQLIDPYMAKKALQEIFKWVVGDDPLLVLGKQKGYLQQVLDNLDAEIMSDPTEGTSNSTDSDPQDNHPHNSLDTQSEPIILHVDNSQDESSTPVKDAWNHVQQEKKGRREERLMKQRTNAHKKKDAVVSSESSQDTNYAFAGFASVVLLFSFAALVS